MSNGLKPAEAEQPRRGKASTLTRFALIGVALAAVVGMFAYFGGWFTPNDLTPARFTDAFEHVDGAHSGFRRNHAKGVGVSGFFESNGNGVRLSKVLVFQAGRVSVIGRFSLSGGQPSFSPFSHYPFYRPIVHTRATNYRSLHHPPYHPRSVVPACHSGRSCGSALLRSSSSSPRSPITVRVSGGRACRRSEAASTTARPDWCRVFAGMVSMTRARLDRR